MKRTGTWFPPASASIGSVVRRAQPALTIMHTIPMPASQRVGYLEDCAQRMNVGDSVLVQTRAQASGLLRALRKFGREGTSRTELDGTGVRVWRRA